VHQILLPTPLVGNQHCDHGNRVWFLARLNSEIDDVNRGEIALSARLTILASRRFFTNLQRWSDITSSRR
jgi:hypothetical protein